MRQQKFIRLNNQQNGYILIVVLSILVLISLMVVATYVTTELSLKSSSYDSDRKYALSIAEQASKIAAKEVAQQFANPQNDIFPPITDYDQSEYPVIFSQLLEGGVALKTVDGKTWPQYFTNDCYGRGKYPGYCTPTAIIDGKQYGNGIPVASRANVFNEFSGQQCQNAVTINQNELPNISARNPCYVVEFLGINPDRVLRYRITVIAWGQNLKTTVKLESTYEMSYD
ncbi:MAG: hypothetical protein GKC53_00600 [Neisseriaceae bacterium]|nr:MAG: hypothetical protein GKC53_00600 [Neisseriaceae bacterium]